MNDFVRKTIEYIKSLPIRPIFVFIDEEGSVLMSVKIIVKERATLCTIGNVNELISIEPGEYEVEEIANPFGVPNVNWFLFKGMNAGASVRYVKEKSLFSIVREP